MKKFVFVIISIFILLSTIVPVFASNKDAQAFLDSLREFYSIPAMKMITMDHNSLVSKYIGESKFEAKVSSEIASSLNGSRVLTSYGNRDTQAVMQLWKRDYKDLLIDPSYCTSSYESYLITKNDTLHILILLPGDCKMQKAFSESTSTTKANVESSSSSTTSISSSMSVSTQVETKEQSSKSAEILSSTISNTSTAVSFSFTSVASASNSSISQYTDDTKEKSELSSLSVNSTISETSTYNNSSSAATLPSDDKNNFITYFIISMIGSLGMLGIPKLLLSSFIDKFIS